MDMNTRSFASEFLSEDSTPIENFAGRGMPMTNATSVAMNTNGHWDSFRSVFPGGTGTTGRVVMEIVVMVNHVFLEEILHHGT